MDWSKAKTILILAFLALNLFLAGQLLEAQKEQSEDRNSTESTKRELNQLAQDKGITILPVDRPTNAPQVAYLEATPTDTATKWTAEPDGSSSKTWNPPTIPVEDWKKQVENWRDYRYHADDSNPVQRVYYQYWRDRPLFDASLTVQVEEGLISAIRFTHFAIEQNNAAQPGVTADTALLSLIESGKLSKGETITAVELGYHGSSYEATVRVLSPVWRIQTDKKVYYVNAITGVSEVATAETTEGHDKQRE
ncbi:two-component system regulatory protein YycI [Desmospora activa]|uniref:Regulatory protein YycI of two-component signal transduction system YycFG n=1 Tax=Desmospora activa DSM 45169 TaxID=1121389 RepID=A0A2T4Z4Q0_9BACL|nr:two-component system regulatory protein YycI [Desmospora activa]PTM56872.1 regulatory protein YycI of two-component signal transduction system YycFG [Desmospora activa DSM 45169]